MIRLLLGVLVEAIVGFSLAGLILAVVVPVLNHFRAIRNGDVIPAGIVAGVVVCVVAVVLARPGSAIKRWLRS
jgi:hypothetical protein